MRNEIIQTSLEQFLKHGIRKMSVQKLISPLVISTKTVYKHFANKEDLLSEALQYYYDKHYDALKFHSQIENPIFLLCNIWYGAMEAETKINKAFFHDLLYYYPELNEKFTAHSTEKFQAIFIDIVKRGIKEGYFTENINPLIFVNGMFILYTSIVRKEALKKLGKQNIILLNDALFRLVRGVCTTKGIKQLAIESQQLQPLLQKGIVQKKVTLNTASFN